MSFPHISNPFIPPDKNAHKTPKTLTVTGLPALHKKNFSIPPPKLARISHTYVRKGEQSVVSDFENREEVNIKLYIGNEQFTKDDVTNVLDFPRRYEKSGLMQKSVKKLPKNPSVQKIFYKNFLPPIIDKKYRPSPLLSRLVEETLSKPRKQPPLKRTDSTTSIKVLSRPKTIRNFYDIND